MTITLHDARERFTVTRVPVAVLLDLAGILPPDVELHIRADEHEITPSEAKPAGYFGLAVAIARDTWHRTTDREYAAYRRGELPDPRD